MRPLEGKVAVVAGATRGAGRAIAVMLAEAGAVVYGTGRSVRGAVAMAGRTETLEDTADLAAAKGGTVIPVRVDHTVPEQVKALFARVREEQGGLDILINDVWGGDELTDWGVKFWEHSLDNGLLMQERAVWSHLITARYGAPLLLERGAGLLVEVTDGTGYHYRGNLYYSLAKISAIHLAEGMAADLRGTGVTALAVTPGFLRSEAMLDLFGVTEANWREGAQKDPHFIASETPYFVARGVLALACDPGVAAKAGRTFSSGMMSKEYDILDVDGARPNWEDYFEAVVKPQLEAGK
jgi:NAD(P)-dependent dehydrogenase (short-subunit alcohol dehydrogenase family)